MSEDLAKRLGDSGIIEQILTKLEVIDLRLQFVETKVTEREFDTKPIWEKALSGIMEVNQRVTITDRKIDVFSRDMLNLRADHLDLDGRLRRLEDGHDEPGNVRT
jgi:hypothetical protein